MTKIPEYVIINRWADEMTPFIYKLFIKASIQGFI